MSSPAEIFCRRLVEDIPELAPILQEHLEDNFDEMLPHVFFGDVTRWVDDALASDPQSAPARELLARLDQAATDGDDNVKELIAVSFLENLDDQSPTIAHLPPGLEKMRAGAQ